MWSVALDTTSHDGSIALLKNATLVDIRYWARLQSHCEVLLSEFDRICQNNKIDSTQINRILVSTGPGSFTGIRVGINFARSLSYALNIPIIPMNALELMAWQTENSDLPICCVQYGFRNLLYYASYRLDQGRIVEMKSPDVITIEEFCDRINEPQIIVGSGFPYVEGYIEPAKIEFLKRLPHYLDFPSAAFFAKALSSGKSLAKELSWTEVEPLYIRASEAEEKLKSSAL